MKFLEWNIKHKKGLLLSVQRGVVYKTNTEKAPTSDVEEIRFRLLEVLFRDSAKTNTTLHV